MTSQQRVTQLMERSICMKSFITPLGQRLLSQELQDLFQVERPKIVREVADAAAQGDRSENAEYIYGKKRLREIDKRIGFLQKRLDDIQVVKPSAQQGPSVQFGAEVEVKDAEGIKQAWMIVGEDEVNPSEGLISYKSPVGRALMSKQMGDWIEIETPKGVLEYEIVSINYKSIRD